MEIIFNEDEEGCTTQSTEKEDVEPISYTHRKNKTCGRQLDTSKLPREQYIHDLQASEKICSCGCQLKKIGEDISEQIDREFCKVGLLGAYLENKPYYICHETIYYYIYKKENKNLYQYLHYKKPKRRKRFARKQQKCRYGDIRLITKRPTKIALRTHYGHWEGDTIEFHGTKKTTVTTLVERKSRLVRLIKNENKISENVMSAIKENFQNEDQEFFKTITFDQGSEFANFPQIETHLPCKTYYCEARSPWQKGTNENMNGRLRRYLPRDTLIHQVTQQQLDLLANKINNLPRKCLGFKKPKELIFQFKRNLCRTWS
jgi:transposase, IS30 family